MEGNGGDGGGDGRDNSTIPLPAPIDPEAILADITRGQWDDYINRFQPTILDTIANVQDTNRTNKIADDAGALVKDSFQSSLGTTQRSLARSGADVSARQKADIGQQRGLAKATTVANVENTTRRSVEDANTSAISELVNQGRGIQRTSLQGLESAATAQTQREQTGAALDFNQTQTAFSSAATGAGIGATFGPVGAAIGGGVGLLLGILS